MRGHCKALSFGCFKSKEEDGGEMCIITAAKNSTVLDRSFYFKIDNYNQKKFTLKALVTVIHSSFLKVTHC